MAGTGRGRGRGAYYRAKYGGGGHGGQRNEGYASQDQGSVSQSTKAASVGPRNWTQLEDDLRSIDGQQYGRST